MTYRPSFPAHGSTHYFDVRLDDDCPFDLTDHVDLLRQSVRISQKRRPFDIHAAVILPRRALMLWTLPLGDVAFSARWHVIKSTFSRHVPHDNAAQVWQPRFWDHDIRDQGDYDLHLHLIMTAPIRDGFVKRASDWPWSSVHHRDVVAERVLPSPAISAIAGRQQAAKLPSWLMARVG